MHVTVENTGVIERRMKVEIPEEHISDEVNNRLKSMSRTVKVPGFRPGKVPLKVVARQYGPRVRNEVVGELIRTSFQHALSQEKLRPVGVPTIDPLDAQPGRGLSYAAVFEVYPDISLKPLDDLVVHKPVAEVTAEDLGRMLDRLRKQRRTWEVVDRPAESGDRVNIDYKSHLEGEEVDAGHDVVVELGSGWMLKEIEAELMGATAGLERTIYATYPDSYPKPALAGKLVPVEVKVKSVQAASVPEFDDQFARELGIEQGGIDALRDALRSSMERELQNAIEARTKTQVLDLLLNENPVGVPKLLVAQEMEAMQSRHREELKRMGLDTAKIPLDMTRLEEHARRRVAIGLILAEVIRSNDLKPDPEKVRAKVELIASAFDNPNQVVQWYQNSPERLADIEAAVLEDQAVEWVLERAQLTPEQSSFDALMNPGQTTNTI